MCDEASLTDEIKHLEEVFVQNGYPRNLTQCVLKKRDHRREHDTHQPQEQLKTLCLPCMKGVSEQVQPMCQWDQDNILNQHTLRSLLTREKGNPLIEQVKGVVYKVPSECGETYIDT